MKINRYIKHQTKRLKQERVNILLKLLVVLIPTIIFTVVISGIFMLQSPPEQWEQKQIVFSSIEKERIKARYSYVLKTTDGDWYILPGGTAEQLSQQLVSNQAYDIVYDENLLTKIIKALSSGNRELIELKTSVAKWEREQSGFYIFLATMLLLAATGSTLIYFLWCKEEHTKIKKIKAKIPQKRV